jgi:hypothetical protein
MQLQRPFAGSRHRLRKLWYDAKGIFYPQRPVIVEACEYVARKCENEVEFSQKLFLFAQILKKQVTPGEQKEETVTEIAEQWFVLRPMILEYYHSDKSDSTTQDKMMIILSNMRKYSKQYPVIFQMDEDTKKQDIKGRRFFSKTDARDDKITLRGHNDKKSTSAKTKKKEDDHSRKGRRHKDESDDDTLKIISRMDHGHHRKSKRESSDDSDDDSIERRLIRLPRDHRKSRRESSDDSDDNSLERRLNRRQRNTRKNRRSFYGSLPPSFSDFD